MNKRYAKSPCGSLLPLEVSCVLLAACLYTCPVDHRADICRTKMTLNYVRLHLTSESVADFNFTGALHQHGHTAVWIMPDLYCCY